MGEINTVDVLMKMEVSSNMNVACVGHNSMQTFIMKNTPIKTICFQG